MLKRFFYQKNGQNFVLFFRPHVYLILFSKFRILPKNFFFEQFFFIFCPKFLFYPKILFLNNCFYFLSKNLIFEQLLLFFVQNFVYYLVFFYKNDFWPKFLFLSKIWIFGQNFLKNPSIFNCAKSAHETGKSDFDAVNEKLKIKRDELSEQIEINSKIEEENRILNKENEEMEKQMSEASEQMITMGDQYEKMKSLYGTRDVQSEQIRAHSKF